MFRPPYFLRGPYAQTILANLWPGPRLSECQSYSFKLADGDSLWLSTHRGLGEQSKVHIVLFHGLAGSENSSYVLRQSKQLLDQGFDVTRVNLRGMGPGFSLAQQVFHANRYADLREVLIHLANKHPAQELVGMGYSLGGTMLLRMAGEDPALLPNQLTQIITVGAPLHLVKSVEKIGRPRNRILEYFFIEKLREYYRQRKIVFGDESLNQSSPWMSLRLFDERITAPHAGFESANDYYEEASAFKFLPYLSVAWLGIVSQDDPLIDTETYSEISKPSSSEIFYTARGGHVGHITGWPRKEESWWLERFILERLLSRRKD